MDQSITTKFFVAPKHEQQVYVEGFLTKYWSTASRYVIFTTVELLYLELYTYSYYVLRSIFAIYEFYEF